MNTQAVQQAIYKDTKPHYEILDGLRGVASILVVGFHLLEVFAGGSHSAQIMNHGYLAVDFFYVLSGFVIGYAYDDRWGGMTMTEFFKRRLIRLHPMIIIGMIIGGLLFYFQDSALWPGIGQVPVWKMLLVMVIGFTLLPVPPSMDIRGWQEMHPLNGPGWSLFFEYIANILYGLVVRKFSNKALLVLVLLAGVALIHLAVTSPNGDIIGGWSVEPTQLRIGFTRLLYPFFAGLLLSRLAKPIGTRHAFLLCTALMMVVFFIPRIGDSDHVWMNGLYDALSVIVIFPLIVYLGAGGSLRGTLSTTVCRFLGDISYPLYITHFPLICVYYAWVTDQKVALQDAWPVGLFVLLLCIAISYAAVKFMDVPVRKWLAERFIK